MISKFESDKKYREANKAKVAAQKAEWCERNKEHKKLKAKEWYAKNRDITIARSNTTYYLDHEESKAKRRANYKKCPLSYVERARKREINLMKAIPSWDTELTELVYREALHLCKLKEALLGVKFHVDHIIPLKGQLVSGLHIWNNFQVITALENQRKKNKYVV